jgi:hypothetical protein
MVTIRNERNILIGSLRGKKNNRNEGGRFLGREGLVMSIEFIWLTLGTGFGFFNDSKLSGFINGEELLDYRRVLSFSRRTPLQELVPGVNRTQTFFHRT